MAAGPQRRVNGHRPAERRLGLVVGVLLEQDHAAQVPRVGLIGLEGIGLLEELQRPGQIAILERRASLLEERITLRAVLAGWE